MMGFILQLPNQPPTPPPYQRPMPHERPCLPATKVEDLQTRTSQDGPRGLGAPGHRSRAFSLPSCSHPHKPAPAQTPRDPRIDSTTALTCSTTERKPSSPTSPERRPRRKILRCCATQPTNKHTDARERGCHQVEDPAVVTTGLCRA
jgi:hypothetical protein